MMKKTLFFGALAAMLLGTASCADENMFGNDGNVCFEIELPGAIESRTISDGEKATALTVAVYDETGAELPKLRQTATLSGKKGTVTFNLVRGKQYSFAFWAQDPTADCYTFTPGTGEVSINYEGICNDEKRDAFYAYRKPQVIDGTITETIKLYRPFAQLNYIATDYAEAVAAGYDVNKSSVTVKNAATSFNLKTGQAGETTTPVTFTLNDRPAEAPTFLKANEGTTYTWMAMNYFIVPNNEAMIETSLTLNEGETPVVENMAVNNVPVKKNHRTNIIGAFMTTQAIFNIEVIPFYDEADYDIVNGVLMLKSKMTADEINYILKNRSGAYALAEDLDLDDQLVVPAGITATLNLNGHNISNSSDIWNGPSWSLISVQGGDLTINGNGQVIAKENDCYTLDVRNGGNLVVNGGDYNSNIHAVYVLEGTAKINGGSFTIQQLFSDSQPYQFILNLWDTNRRNGTASIEVTGGKYYKFDPANNEAEGKGTNFVALGYESVQDGDWYTVRLIPPLSDPAEIAAAVAIPGATVNIVPGIEVAIDLRNIAEGVTIIGNGAKLLLNQTNNKVNAKGITLNGFTIVNTQSGTASIIVNASTFNMKDCELKPSAGHTWGVHMSNMNENGVYNFDGIVSDASLDSRLIGPECKGVVNISNSILKSGVYTLSTVNIVSDCEINVTNTQLIGWTSFNTGTNKTYNFENCYFGKLNYGYFRPYGGNGTNVINVKNCTFSNDYAGINPQKGATVNITNSKYENGDVLSESIVDTGGATGKVVLDGTVIFENNN